MLAIHYPNRQSIYEYVTSCFDELNTNNISLKEHLKDYAEGLIASHKKSIKGIKRALNLKNHTSTIYRSLKKARYLFKNVKNDLYNRIDTFIDRRSNFYISVDDTHLEKYGKKVYGASYQHDHTKDSILWCNTLVDDVVTSKKGDLFLRAGYLSI